MATKKGSAPKPVNMEQVRRSLAHAQGSLDKALELLGDTGTVNFATCAAIVKAQAAINTAVVASKEGA